MIRLRRVAGEYAFLGMAVAIWLWLWLTEPEL